MENYKIYKNLLINLLLCLSVFNFVKTSTPDSPTYTVAVAEFSPETNAELKDRLKINLNGYRDLLTEYIERTDIGKEVDIITFPEATLNNVETSTFIPDPKTNTVLCDTNNPEPEFLALLSCWAGKFKKYMVFNIIEKVNCTKDINNNKPCPENGIIKYNSNVVFDRNGAIISKYRKWNLFKEYDLNVTNNPEIISFDTDFGVKFGTFICFDILFWTPTQKLIQNGIKDIVYPTMWFSELPFLTANQIQQAWAFANNVTFLVSGASDPIVGSTGTGIFAGRDGALLSGMESQRTNKMYIIKVPKYNSQINSKPNQDPPTPSIYPTRITGLKVTRDETVNKYANILLNSSLDVTETVCHDKFCCNFKIVRKNLTEYPIHYSYRLIAYAGERDYAGIRKSWIKTCAVITCTDDQNINSCGKVFDSNIEYRNTHYFKSIEISGDFKKQDELLIMPNSVDAKFLPLPVNTFDFSSADIGKTTRAVMKLEKDASDILTFGIYAQYYNGFSSASKISSCLMGLILASFILLCYRIK